MSAPCGEFSRWHMREAVGPRGGRQTFWSLECAACRSRTPERRSKTAGSQTSVEAALRAALAARTCPRPRVVSPAAAWLRVVARAAMDGPPSLRFVVEHQLTEPVPHVTARAWAACDSGYAMGALAAAAAASPIHAARSWRLFVQPPRYSTDGAVTFAHALADGVRVELMGPDAEVAALLRRLMPHPPRIAGWTIPEGGGAP